MSKIEFMQTQISNYVKKELKNYRITYYEDDIKRSFIVQATSEEEAEKIGWSRVDADSLYVTAE